MNIQKEFEAVIEKYGHDIIYVRTDKRFRCTCFSERSGGPGKSKCKKCFGTGYHTTTEVVKVRRQISSLPESLVRTRNTYETGSFAAKAFVYYFTKSVKPKTGDIILEVNWKNNIPISIKDSYLISIADGKQGDQGEIEFYQVYCKYQSEGSDERNALT